MLARHATAAARRSRATGSRQSLYRDALPARDGDEGLFRRAILNHCLDILMPPLDGAPPAMPLMRASLLGAIELTASPRRLLLSF